MVATAVEGLEAGLGTDATKNTFVYDTYTIAEDICLFHGVSGEHHGTAFVLFAFLKNVP